MKNLGHNYKSQIFLMKKNEAPRAKSPWFPKAQYQAAPAPSLPCRQASALSKVQFVTPRTYKKSSHLFFMAVLIVSFAGTGHASDNFGHDFTKTQPISNYQTKKQPQIKTTPTIPSAPRTPVFINTPSLTQNINSQAQTPPQTSYTSQMSALDKLTKPKITVPDFEQKYKDILKALEEKAAKKKKKLSETLLEEIDRYGIYINIVLILLIVIYVIYKERWKSSHPDGESTSEENKDIWHENF